MGAVSGVPMEKWVRMMEGGMMVHMGWRRRVAFARVSGGGGFGTKNPKPSPGGSVSGAPMETGVGDDKGRLYGGVYEMVAAAACCIRLRERWWGGLGPKSRNRA
jgi:hypothetical protein